MIRFDILRKTIAASTVPEPFAPGKQQFWENRYIRRHVLNAHLDPETDDGSRTEEEIDRSVDWIHHRFEAPGSLLDLGCGPGLYTHRFSSLGWRVTGIDLSHTSIAYAKRHAPRTGHLNDRYITGDYLRRELPGNQDLVLLIYGNICVISDAERDRLLDRIRRCLSPGGKLIFDAFTQAYVQRHRIPDGWYTSRSSGFWNPGAHLVLQDSHEYSNHVLLNRYTVIPRIGRIRTFHLWYNPANTRALESQLRKHGFDDISFYGDLAGTPRDPEGEWIGAEATGS